MLGENTNTTRSQPDEESDIATVYVGYAQTIDENVNGATKPQGSRTTRIIGNSSVGAEELQLLKQ